MKWNEISIKCTKEDIDILSNILIESGANGTTIVDPDEIREIIKNLAVYEYADDKMIPSDGHFVTAYFSIDENIEQLINIIKKRISEFKVTLKHTVVDDETWKHNWKKFYKQFSISKRIKIIPSWDADQLVLKKTDVIMEPGMAFGTGNHETTSLCARLIDQYIKVNDDVIDVGCGTGILSIIAKKLGAKYVTSIDIDIAATKATTINVKKNQVEDVTIITGELSAIDNNQKVDMITANIISDIIIDLADAFKSHLKKDGLLICSGIILMRETDVLTALKKSGFTIKEIKYDNEWVGIVANA